MLPTDYAVSNERLDLSKVFSKKGVPFKTENFQPEFATWLLGVKAEESEESDGEQSASMMPMKQEHGSPKLVFRIRPTFGLQRM